MRFYLEKRMTYLFYRFKALIISFELISETCGLGVEFSGHIPHSRGKLIQKNFISDLYLIFTV